MRHGHVFLKTVVMLFELSSVLCAQPFMLTEEAQAIELIPPVVPEPVDLEAVLQQDSQRSDQDGGPFLFAICRAVEVTPETDGAWKEVDGNILLWRLPVISPGALSISLGFTRYQMPPDGRLYVYTADHAQVLGPFTVDDNKEHGQLWTPVLDSDSIVLEVSIPIDQANELELELGYVNHGYRDVRLEELVCKDLGDSGSCNVNVACDAGDSLRDQIRSVARLQVAFLNIERVGWSTGCLINNTAQDGKPYLLTAFHSFDENDDWVLSDREKGYVANMIVYWNFQASTCSGNTLSDSQTQTGGILRAADGWSGTDFALVELTETPSKASNVYYAGWDRRDVAPSSGVAIHHPGGDLKKISVEEQPLSITLNRSTSSSGVGDYLCVADWDTGTTEKGSSGCPLFNPYNRVVGQLSGGDAACGNSEPDWFGRIHKSWTGGGTRDTRLSDWLDPGNTGVVVLDGKGCEADMVFFADTFPSRTIDTSNWTAVNGATVDDVGIGEPSSPYSLRLNDFDSVESRTIDLSPYPKVTLTYSYQHRGVGHYGGLQIDYYDGSRWTMLDDHWSGTDMASFKRSESIDLPVEALHADFRLRISSIYLLVEEEPANSSEWFVDDVKLETSSSGPCPVVVSGSGYYEDFESGFGDWVNVPESDDIDWTRHSGPTDSGNTGPISAAGGTYYLYVESSGAGKGYPNKTAILESPCINIPERVPDLDDALCGWEHYLNFRYHMQGAQMGDLTIEVSEDEGASWNQLWSCSGDQGSGWKDVHLFLGSYYGKTVKLRFKGTTGSDYTSDIAIDTISIVDQYVCEEIVAVESSELVN